MLVQGYPRLGVVPRSLPTLNAIVTLYFRASVLEVYKQNYLIVASNGGNSPGPSPGLPICCSLYRSICSLHGVPTHSAATLVVPRLLARVRLCPTFFPSWEPLPLADGVFPTPNCRTCCGVSARVSTLGEESSWRYMGRTSLWCAASWCLLA